MLFWSVHYVHVSVYGAVRAPVLYFFVTCRSLYPNSKPELFRGWTKALTNSVHAAASPGIGERVPLQPLSDPQTEGGDCPYTVPIRTTD